MGEFFGTDGVRGIPGKPPLTPDSIQRLGSAAGEVFGRGRKGSVVVMGRDTRGSGPRLSRHLSRGFSAAGCRIVDLGVVPTPAVSYLCPRLGAACGVVVSASHNPPEFNGIKFFTGKGLKVPPKTEAFLERRWKARRRGRKSSERPSRYAGEAVRDYADFLRSTFPAYRDLSGLRIVFDGSNGAGARIGQDLLRGLGADVHPLGCRPDGGNINVGCGAVHTERMRAEVVRRKAHCGVALDGDADRAVLADEHGRLLDGDALIALSALRLHEGGRLRGGKVVLTVMSNLGLIRFLETQGIGTLSVPVGDRNVSDALISGDHVLGGENSGHVIFRDLAPTGDGLLTALQTLGAWLDRGGPLSRVGHLYRRYPAVLKNIRTETRVDLEGLAGFQRAVRAAERKMGDSGRIFVRYSGTEPLLRILVEGEDGTLTRRTAEDLVQAFKKEV